MLIRQGPVVDDEDLAVLALQESYRIDQYRTVEQDLAFGVKQIVDIVLRALSPGINDTTTAVMCSERSVPRTCRWA